LGARLDAAWEVLYDHHDVAKKAIVRLRKLSIPRGVPAAGIAPGAWGL